MTDEQTTAAALGSAAAAPLFGQYALIGLAAAFGALWTISRTDGLNLWGASKLFFRAVSLAMVFTGIIAHYVSELVHYQIHELLSPIAFTIAWVGDRWLEVRDTGFRMGVRFLLKFKRSTP